MIRRRMQAEPEPGRYLLLLLLLVYGAAMIFLPVLLFGLPAGLWISAGLLAGGVGVVIVLTGANRHQSVPAPAEPQARVIKITPATLEPGRRTHGLPLS